MLQWWTGGQKTLCGALLWRAAPPGTSQLLANSSCLSEGLHRSRPWFIMILASKTTSVGGKKGDWLWLICLHTSWHRWPSYCNLRRTTCVLFLPSITCYLIRSNVWRMIRSSHNVFRSQWESGKSHLLDCNYDRRVFLCSAAWKNWGHTACCRVSEKRNIKKNVNNIPSKLVQGCGLQPQEVP